MPRNRYCPPKHVVVLVDSREAYPLRFPASFIWFPTRNQKPSYRILVDTKIVTLPAGDYALEGFSRTAIVERKGCLSELVKNIFSRDRARFLRALTRLRDATSRAYLLLEETPAGLLPSRPTPYQGNPDCCVDELVRLLLQYNLNFLFVGRNRSLGSRRKLGLFVLKLLAGHAFASQAPDFSELDLDTTPAAPYD